MGWREREKKEGSGRRTEPHLRAGPRLNWPTGCPRLSLDCCARSRNSPLSFFLSPSLPRSVRDLEDLPLRVSCRACLCDLAIALRLFLFALDYYSKELGA